MPASGKQLNKALTRAELCARSLGEDSDHKFDDGAWCVQSLATGYVVILDAEVTEGEGHHNHSIRTEYRRCHDSGQIRS